MSFKPTQDEIDLINEYRKMTESERDSVRMLLTRYNGK